MAANMLYKRKASILYRTNVTEVLSRFFRKLNIHCVYFKGLEMLRSIGVMITKPGKTAAEKAWQRCCFLYSFHIIHVILV